MAKLHDVARLAGVSTTTVSHALNGSRRVHPDTKHRIVRAVEALGYRPNRLARSLRRKQTHTIGLLVSDIELPYFTEIARTVENVAYERGYSVILCNTDESLEKEVLYAGVLFDKQVDGLIIAPVRGDHAYLRHHLDRGTRVVFINRYLDDLNVPAVVLNDEIASYELASQLLGDGHRRLGAVLGLPGVSTTENRLIGLRRALEQYGLTLDDVWMFPGEARRSGGLAAGRALSEMVDPPTAVIAFNTALVDGVLLGMLEHAPHLLSRIELTGFGYSPVARICGASRYAVDSPTHEVGTVAATLLLNALDSGAELAAGHVVLPSRLIDFGPAPSGLAAAKEPPSFSRLVPV